VSEIRHDLREKNMSPLLLLAVKVAVSACIGLLVGLEREWAHKEAGVRTFAIAALLGTLSWLVSPTLAMVQMSVVLVVLVLINIYGLRKEQEPQITTSLALAVTDVLGIVVGMGGFFLAFTAALVVTALLAWKTELITFISKLTVEEIRSILLLGFITAVIYPLLPDQYIDPWHVLNPRSIWLTIVIVSSLNFINYVLLRQFGTRGIRYSAILGGLVNSAATSLMLGQEAKDGACEEKDAATNVLFSDLAMILRNILLVVIFALPASAALSLPVVVVLAPMMLVGGVVVLVLTLFARKPEKPEDKEQQQNEQPHKKRLRSPLELRSVATFGALFLILTVVSGGAQRLFGAIGFMAVIVIGALASAASSSVLVGQHLAKGLGANPAAIAMFLATLVGLLENVVIFWIVTKKPALGLRLLLLTLPIALAGAVASALALLLAI
jgi:uncharacterized membrane protein (DUF4010 family)